MCSPKEAPRKPLPGGLGGDAGLAALPHLHLGFRLPSLPHRHTPSGCLCCQRPGPSQHVQSFSRSIPITTSSAPCMVVCPSSPCAPPPPAFPLRFPLLPWNSKHQHKVDSGQARWVKRVWVSKQTAMSLPTPGVLALPSLTSWIPDRRAWLVGFWTWLMKKIYPRWGEGGPPSLPPNRMFLDALYFLQEKKKKKGKA